MTLHSELYGLKPLLLASLMRHELGMHNVPKTKLIVQLLSKIYERNNQNDKLFSLEDFLWINLPNAIFDYFF